MSTLKCRLLVFMASPPIYVCPLYAALHDSWPPHVAIGGCKPSSLQGGRSGKSSGSGTAPGSLTQVTRVHLFPSLYFLPCPLSFQPPLIGKTCNPISVTRVTCVSVPPIHGISGQAIAESGSRPPARSRFLVSRKAGIGASLPERIPVRKAHGAPCLLSMPSKRSTVSAQTW